MRVGTVRSVGNRLRPLTPVWVEGVTLEADVLIAEIDTGYSGYLTLPKSDIERLKLEFKRLSEVVMADGSSKRVNVYDAEIVWWDQPLRIEVHELETDRLIVISLLTGYTLKIDVRLGGSVEIESSVP